MTTILKLHACFIRTCDRIPGDAVLLLGRLAMASVFWRSAQTRIAGWDLLGQHWQFFNVQPGAVMLFRYEYGLPLLSPTVAAYLATGVEFWGALLLALGLGTRLAALALLGVTMVIQVFVYPDAWPTHILWFALLLVLLREGGGKLAVERLFRQGTYE